ncbi:MAG: competence/damage-inducible protein A [Firmicutes bacterium]|nr:competence/damage-inducible protein A [Candidatus Fermentithermobacillaceae bacterium]
MQAEILSVGTELLLGEITDTNAQYISARLREIGVSVYRRETLGDNRSRLTGAFREALGRASLVIATGGLGPTDDDVTAECLAAALGLPLEFHEGAWEDMLEWYRVRGRTPSPGDRKQAMIIGGGIPFRNKVGTAPGQAILTGGKLACVLPGPPREMIPMFEEHLVPLIQSTFTDLVPLYIKNLKLTGIPEVKVGEMIRDLMDSANPTVAPYAGRGEIRIRIAAGSEDLAEARKMVAQVADEVKSRLRDYIYGEDDDTLESAVGEIMSRRGLSIATAESVTGGLVAHRLTNVPGSSRYFKMGMVAYSPAIKATCLGVPDEAIWKDEAVNEETAVSMASGVRTLAGAKIGLATTGFAGPTGGTEKEPVGTVYVAVSDEDGTEVERFIYTGSRRDVKEYGAGRALYVLWRRLKRSRRKPQGSREGSGQ